MISWSQNKIKQLKKINERMSHLFQLCISCFVDIPLTDKPWLLLNALNFGKTVNDADEFYYFDVILDKSKTWNQGEKEKTPINEQCEPSKDLIITAWDKRKGSIIMPWDF